MCSTEAVAHSEVRGACSCERDAVVWQCVLFWDANVVLWVCILRGRCMFGITSALLQVHPWVG